MPEDRRRRRARAVWRLGAAVLLAALALAGEAAAATRFLAVGDFGVGGETERATGRAMRTFAAGHPAAALVALGDNDYTESPAAFAANWQDAFGWVEAAGVRVAGVLGNHDYAVDDGAYELTTLGLPRRRYQLVRLGPVALFLLDSNRVDTAQTAWLERRLKAATAPWKVAVLHHPPYVCGYHSGNEEVQRRWVPLFERYGVELVLSGHEHSYQRFLARAGVTYVVHGGGGAAPYLPLACPDGYPARARKRFGYGFLSVVARPGSLTVTALDRLGRRVDRVRLAR